MELTGIVYFNNTSVSFCKESNIEFDLESSFIRLNKLEEIKKRDEFPFFFDLKFQNQQSFLFESGLYEASKGQINFDDFDKDKLIKYKIRSVFGLQYCDKQQKVSLFRDAFGLIPFYYLFIPHKFIAFSTCINSLIQIKEVKKRIEINHNRVLIYLQGGEDYSIYNDQTFYKGIKSVLPGHVTTIDLYSVNIEPYLIFEHKQRISSDTEYVKELKRLFSDSVETSIGKESIVGSHLSGGLDSSSISVICRELKPQLNLHTFYFNASPSFKNENKYVMPVVNKIHSNHHIISPSSNFLSSIYAHTYNCGYPSVLIIGPSHREKMNNTAENIGINIMLEGEGGDSCLGHGYQYLDELLNDLDLNELERVLESRSKLGPFNGFKGDWNNLNAKEKLSSTIYNFYFLRLFRRNVLNKTLKRQILTKVYLKYGKGFLNYSLKRSKDALMNRVTGKYVTSPSIVSDDFNKEYSKDEINSINPINLITNNTIETDYALQSMYNSRSILILEEFYNASHNGGIIAKFPFFNTDLFELNLNIPSSLKYNSGLTRGHMREAMKGLLPETTRLRYDKADFSDYGITMAKTLLIESKELLENNKDIWQYVNKKSFTKVAQLINENRYFQRNDIIKYILRTVTLAVWLNYYNENKLKGI